MPMILKSTLWALAIIAVALLGAFDILSEPVAQNLVIVLPALEASVLFLPACGARRQRSRT